MIEHVGSTKGGQAVNKNRRADYGKQIVVSLTRQLEETYGRTAIEKIRRMMYFAKNPAMNKMCRC